MLRNLPHTEALLAQFESLTIELIGPFDSTICTIRRGEKFARMKANSAPHSGECAQSITEGIASYRVPHTSSMIGPAEDPAGAVDVERNVP